MLSLVSDGNIISLPSESKNFLDELDFIEDIICDENHIEEPEKKRYFSDILSKFLYKFDNSDGIYFSLNEELRNSFYMNKQINVCSTKSEVNDLYKELISLTYRRETMSLIDDLFNILDDLELINKDLSRRFYQI